MNLSEPLVAPPSFPQIFQEVFGSPRVANMRRLGLIVLFYLLLSVLSLKRRPKLSHSSIWRLKGTKNSKEPFDCIDGAATLEGPIGFEIAPMEKDKKKDIAFTIYGEPIALARHRTVSGGLRTYNPSASDQKKFAKACVTADVLPKEPLQGPVEACMTFYFQRPKHHFRTGKFAGQVKAGQDVWHSKKKDLDNLVKFVLDSLNALAYLDDGQVCSIQAAKFYTSDAPRTEISFRALPRDTDKGPLNGEVGNAVEKKEPKTSKQKRKVAAKAAKQAEEERTVTAPIKGSASVFACSS